MNAELMSAVETGQMYSIKTGQRPVAIVEICLVSTANICPVSAADICPVSTADISISIHHSASAFSINNQHIMEAATAADFWLRLLAIASLGSDKIASRMRGGTGRYQGLVKKPIEGGTHKGLWVSS